MSVLTDAKLEKIYFMKYSKSGAGRPNYHINSHLSALRAVAEAAVAAHGERGEEPVAWRIKWEGEWMVTEDKGDFETATKLGWEVIPLTHLQPAGVPEGWSINRGKDGAIVITHKSIGGVVVERNPRHAREIPESILWELADAMLTTTQEKGHVK